MQRKSLRQIIFLLLLMFGVFRIRTGFAFTPQDALEKAIELIETAVFSETELIGRLQSNGFSQEDAVYAAANCGADWDAMASARVSEYLEHMVFSESGLIEQLIHDGFTREQAFSAAEKSGTDWDQLALHQARSHLNIAYRTTDQLIRLLILDGFTEDQAVLAAEKVLDVNSNIPAGTEFSGEPGEVGTEMLDVLANHLQILFPIQSLNDQFPSYMQPAYTDIGPGTVLQTRNQDGVRKLKLLVNPGYEKDLRTTTQINSGSLQNFMLSMDVYVDDVFPHGGGGCFIAYTNELMPTVPDEAKEIVALLANRNGVEFYRKAKDADTGTHTMITDNVKSSYKLTLIRLTGLTFAFIDEEYAGQFADSTEGPFHLMYGNAVFSGGDNAYCGFDNLAVRKVNN